MSTNALSTRVAGVAALAAILVPTARAQTTTLVYSGFSEPVYVTSPPGDMNRLFVVEQHTGRIEIIKDGQLLPTAFLTVAGVLGGGEQGLLGLAFHPDYATNGFFYINATLAGGGAAGHTEIRRYTVSGNPDIANVGFVTIFTENQPFSNHNGGNLQFGPDDMLYVGLGDGGSANDPGNRAQDLNVRLGKMLRMTDSGGDPGDNPWSSDVDGISDLIWAYGLRNPWRYSFDRTTGDLYIADVGQNAVEEIDFQAASSTGMENYGWRCMEGTSCTGLSGCTCNVGLVLPIHQYTHGAGCSVTGGYVYRGSAIPSLQGHYFFADYCAGTIWSFQYTGSVTNFTNRTAQLNPLGTASIDNPVSFGEDAAGEMYIVDQDGEIWKIVPSGDVGTAFCNADDGSHASCPCVSGTQNPDAGCDVAQATGGVVATALAQDTVAFQATLVGTGYPAATTPTAIVMRGNNHEPTPVPFGDGIQCVGTVGLVRLGATNASAGTSTHLIPHNSAFPPASFYYQIWFRNQPASYCSSADAFNLSSGQRLFWP